MRLLLLLFIGVMVGVYVGRGPHHQDQCVVCKPSGKLAMWGECE